MLEFNKLLFFLQTLIRAPFIDFCDNQNIQNFNKKLYNYTKCSYTLIDATSVSKFLYLGYLKDFSLSCMIWFQLSVTQYLLIISHFLF